MIHLNLLNIRSKIWRQSLNICCENDFFRYCRPKFFAELCKAKKTSENHKKQLKTQFSW